MQCTTTLTLTFTLLLALLPPALHAIEPVFEGPDGIKAQVFAPSCLSCHASTLTGLQRRAAPTHLNWDIYEVAKINTSRIINSAVINQYMPPAQTGNPVLNQQQAAALLAWEAAGFPEFSAYEISFDMQRSELLIPSIQVGAERYRVRLRLFALTESPSGYGFELLESVLLVSTVASTVASTAVSTEVPAEPALAHYDTTTSSASLTNIHLLKSAAGYGYTHANVKLQLLPGQTPLRFVATFLQRLP
jgi:hypothetical protein